MNMLIVIIVIFVIAVLMTITGRGGGNFYVLVLVAAGYSIHQAATTGQFILMLTAFAGMLIFHKHKLVDWKLALVIDPPTLQILWLLWEGIFQITQVEFP